MKLTTRLLAQTELLAQRYPTCQASQNAHRDALKVSKALDTLTNQKRVLLSALRGDELATQDAKALAELGFRLVHPYFSSDEYVTLGNASGYPINGNEWDKFWSDREDFPTKWKLLDTEFPNKTLADIICIVNDNSISNDTERMFQLCEYLDSKNDI